MNPTWQEFIVYGGNNRVPTIYCEAIKVLLGTVDMAKLFYDNLCHLLVNELGFELSSYNTCVANKIINGKQCTIVWHVDNLNISHVNPEVVTQIISELENRFAQTIPLSISSGLMHTLA